MSSATRRIAIVGGGAAGIYAGLSACRAGGHPVLFERNKRPGIKILISGGGKCNITHDAPPEAIEDGFIPSEARFLRYALHELTSGDVLAELHREGVETITRPNGRVFPASGRADDVLSAFERMMQREGVEVQTNARVDSVQVMDGAVAGIVLNGEMLRFDAVIIATGGMSYRKVGTTGDGIRWAESLGHTIVPVRPALAPIYFDVPPPDDWQGVALRDVVFRIEHNGSLVKPSRRDPYPTEWRDDLLLTHRGISGPAVLEVSRAAARAHESGSDVYLVVDLLPDVSDDTLQQRWNERRDSSGRSEVQTFVETIVPKSLARYLLASADVAAGTRISDVKRHERMALLQTLKHWRLGRLGEVPMDKGEVTAGGVALNEVIPTTMESKLIRGLYFAGEALDISGRVGGYNLQAAFSTGFVAGREAAKKIMNAGL
jgi:predicted Rossmann fold flavoprotein